MTIKKHGQYYSKHPVHVVLYGKCEKCGCEFETFVDIHYSDSDEGIITIVTDKECTDMKIEPEFVYDERWIGSKFVIEVGSNRAIRKVDYSCWCPECREAVELKEKTRV